MDEQVEIEETGELPQAVGFGRRFLRFLLRFIVVIVVGTALGMGAYYGIPALYRDFIEPIQANSGRIAALEESVARVQVDFREKNVAFTTELAQVEGEVAQLNEDFSELSAAQGGLASRFEDLTTVVEDNQVWSTRIVDLEDRQQTLDARFGAMEKSLEDEDMPYDQLKMQIQLLRSMELVTRARYWMIYGNLGDASADLSAAKGILEVLDAGLVEGETLLLILDQLNQVVIEMSLNPIIAADDLEIVWQLLLLATEP